jgi:hypothetical protein
MGAAHIFCSLHGGFFCHDDDIILASSSLNKQLVDRWRDRLMGAAHIFLLIARWLFSVMMMI